MHLTQYIPAIYQYIKNYHIVKAEAGRTLRQSLLVHSKGCALVMGTVWD